MGVVIETGKCIKHPRDQILTPQQKHTAAFQGLRLGFDPFVPLKTALEEAWITHNSR
jgi:hypothetical protein